MGNQKMQIYSNVDGIVFSLFDLKYRPKGFIYFDIETAEEISLELIKIINDYKLNVIKEEINNGGKNA